MITIYHNPRCRKSRECLAILEEKKKSFEIIEYLKKPLNKTDLIALVKLLGIKPEEMIRKNETVFKDNYKGKSLSDSDWISAMVKFPNLMERPIVVSGKEAAICRPPELVKEII